jgi:predicted phage terminase large subunit-like protein
MGRNDAALLLEAIEFEECRRSLYAFVRRFWRVVEPGTDFIDNWHIEAICQHLQAVTEGKIKRLVINVPFRTAKSTITSVLWPAWVWINKPEHQWLCGSYAEKLAIRDSLRMRRLVQSPDYVRGYGKSFAITSDQNQKVRFQNTKNGHRIAFGMGGGVMGDGGDTLLIDDPHDRQGANSEAERDTVLTTYDEALITRLNHPASGAIVIIMQRLHQKDLSGHVLADKAAGWVHLMIPMEFEAQRKCKTMLGWEDPRKRDGELMFPARFPQKTVDGLKTVLGTYGTAGQLQQRPSPAGGGVLDISHFKTWPADAQLPDLHFILQSYDTAFTDNTQNDPTACTVWGIFYRGEKRCVLLLESWTDRLQYPALRKRLLADWKAEYGGILNDPNHPSRRADVVLIEEKGSGQSVIQDLRQANVPVAAYNPGRADKTSRAEMTAPLLECGLFYVLESKKDPGQPIRWARPLLEQMEQFPNGEHDDLVDTFTQAAIYLRDAELLELDTVDEEPPEDIDYHERTKRAGNPYFA